MATRFAWLRSRKTISLSIAIAAIALGLFTPKDANAGATILTHASYQDITSEANDFLSMAIYLIIRLANLNSGIWAAISSSLRPCSQTT